MDRKLPIWIIRVRYRRLMAEIYDCLAQNGVPKGLAVRTRVNKLLVVLISMEGSREILNMKASLNLMGNKLNNLPFSTGAQLNCSKDR